MSIHIFAARRFLHVARNVTAALLAVAFLLSMAHPSFAAGATNGNLNGTVTDASSKAPIVGATVTIASPSNRYTAKTDGRGFFSIIQAVVDTYTLSVTGAGYSSYTTTVTIDGDSTVTAGSLTLTKSLTTIGRTAARAANSAFQPGQTVNTYTITGATKLESQGKDFRADQNSVLLANPGVTLDRLGGVSIRGSLATEVGYQVDGINFTDPDHGGQIINGGFINGIASVNTTPGAGDATQGNSGGGTINLVYKRGTNPEFGTLDLETNSYPYFHQGAFEYGFASPNSRFSNYTSFLGSNLDFQYGPAGTQTALANRYASQGTQINRDFVNNMVYKFGKDNNQSLQFLFQTHSDANLLDVGGLTEQFQIGSVFYVRQYTLGGPGGCSVTGRIDGGSASRCAVTPAELAQISTLFPGSPTQTSYGQFATAPANSPNENEFLEKLEYTNNFNASTFGRARFYQTNLANTTEGPYTRSPFSGSRQQTNGGKRVGLILELNKQLGENNLVTVSGEYADLRPVFGIIDPGLGAAVASGQLGVGRPAVFDYLTPANTTAPISAANPCPIGTFTWTYNGGLGGNAGSKFTEPGCFLYSHGVNTTIVPSFLASPANVTQLFGFGLHDQITAGKFKADIGVRFDGANYHLPSGLDYGVAPITDQTQHPFATEPRFALSYRLTDRDSLRASYGRSVELSTVGNTFTPLDILAYQKYAGGAFANLPSPTTAAICGSASDPAVAQRPCANYGDYARWENDVQIQPDNGNIAPTSFNNFDASLGHAFRNGSSVRITPFFRRGYNVQVLTANIIGLDPVTGAPLTGPFQAFNQGIEKTTGVEFFATTADKPVGLGGFFTATYQNSITNTPPFTGGENSQPQSDTNSLALGALYRSGLFSPLVIRTGLNYKTRSGFRINPVLNYDRGYPTGVGRYGAGIVNNVLGFFPNTNANPSHEFGAVGQTNYVDPTNPGTLLAPNVFVTRGTADGNQAGGVLTRPRILGDMTFEYKAPHTRQTFGIAVLNIFNNYYSEPGINGLYQPVATGVAGPLTGVSTLFNNPRYTVPGGYAQYGIVNFNNTNNGLQPYSNSLTQGRTVRFYYQLGF